MDTVTVHGEKLHELHIDLGTDAFVNGLGNVERADACCCGHALDIPRGSDGREAACELRRVSAHNVRVNAACRQMTVFGAGVLLAFFVGGTAAAFFFFVIVFGVSGGSATIGAAAEVCFVLLVVEVAIGMRLARRRGRYSQP